MTSNDQDERYFALATQWANTLAADDPHRFSIVVTRPNSPESRAFLDAFARTNIKVGVPAPVALKAPERPAGGQVEPGADDLTGQQVQAVHDALRIIAGLCDGAQALDDRGFNKLDTRFGHDLASRVSLSQKQAKWGKTLVVKYQRQIPAELLAVVKGGAQ
jgi:hypothetical protein